MWVKRACKESFPDAFSKSIQLEKDMFCFKDNLDTSSKQDSTSRKKIDNAPKPTTTAQDHFNMSDMKKILQKMSNEMVDLKKTNNKNQSNNRVFNRPAFRRPNQPPQNPRPQNPSEGFMSEEIFFIFKALATGTLDIPESSGDQLNQES